MRVITNKLVNTNYILCANYNENKFYARKLDANRIYAYILAALNC